MALLIYLKEQGAGALIMKGTIEEFLDELRKVHDKIAPARSRIQQRAWVVCTSWQDKKLAIAEDMISHLAEETDEQINKNVEAQKKRAEEMAKAEENAKARAQGRNVIQTPKLVIPGRGHN